MLTPSGFINLLDLLGEHGTIKTEIVRWWYIGLLYGLCLKKAVYREYAVFFMLKVYRFVAEIISTNPLLSFPVAILRLPLVGTRWAGKASGRPLRS